MKHRWMLVLIGLGVACWGGCGREQSEPTDSDAAPSITIWWAQWDPADGLQELGHDFEKETGIKVKVFQISWAQYQRQVFLELGKRNPGFDIVVGDSQWIGKGATEGHYLDLTDWLPNVIDLSEIHPRAALYLCEYPTGSGHYYAAPCETDAVGLVYRKDWFADPANRQIFQAKYGYELQVPETWSQFRDIAEFFYKPDEKRYGCALLTGATYDSLTMGFQHFMWAFGGDWHEPNGFKVEGFVNGEGTMAGMRFMKSVLAYAPADRTNIDYARCLEKFRNGSTAMIMNYFALLPQLLDMERKVGFAVMPGHKMPDGTIRRAVSLGGQGFSISTKISSEQQERAKKFIAWFLQKRTQEHWITKPAGFTAHTAILNSPAFREATPFNGPFAESLEHMQDFWNVPQFGELLNSAQKHLRVAMEADSDAETKQGLDNLAKEHEKILKDAGFLN